MIAKLIKIALIAGIVLALASTLSCGQHDFWDDIFGPSCGTGGSGNFDYGSVTDKDGKTYRTVKIGKQRWMAENLATDVNGSVCYGNDPANCSKYGRLYSWIIAMVLPYECRNEESVDCIIEDTHQGICPAGWHIPSNKDWNDLLRFINPSCPDGCTDAGTKLKATCGWDRDIKGKKSGNGTDDYGFAGMPSGARDITESGFVGDGYFGWYLTTTEGHLGLQENTDHAYVSYSSYGLGHGWSYAVRCIQDTSSFISSSSSVSSSSVEIVYGTPVNYQGETYKTVVIGNQIWMARNLNYAVEGSKCYDNSTANCNKYGRLYDWVTAMKLPASCNDNSCASQVSQKHQGICPDGWQIPNDDDWYALMKFVNPNCYDDEKCGNVGNKLKATSGWSYDDTRNTNGTGNGQDIYGFTALPGGGGSDGYFAGVGYSGSWWSSSEVISQLSAQSELNANDWNITELWYLWNRQGKKNDFYSVRCMQYGNGGGSLSSSSFISSSSVSSSSVEIVYGTPVNYQGETYKTVVIGSQTWMARNLNYAVEGSKCGNGSNLSDANTTTCDTYGRLYNWATAMALSAECNSTSCSSQINAKHRGICPNGWHIPSNADWNVLMKFVNPSCSDNNICADAGYKLKATNGWNGDYGNGQDTYGFSALPGGCGLGIGSFETVGSKGSWWSSNESGLGSACFRGMSSSLKYVDYYFYTKVGSLSIRCLKDGVHLSSDR